MFEAPYEIEPLSELEKVRSHLVKAVEEKGADYIYPLAYKSADVEAGYESECVYATLDEQGNKAPSCLVGHAFSYDGLLSEVSADEGMAARVVAERIGYSSNDSVLGALDAAQNAQDRGGTWGEALDTFDLHILDRRARGY